MIITTEQHKTNKAYHKVRNEKGRYQLPNTGINNDTSSPLISFTFVSGLFLILRSMRRRKRRSKKSHLYLLDCKMNSKLLRLFYILLE